MKNTQFMRFLLQKDVPELKDFLFSFLKSKYGDKAREAPSYIFAQGDLPICLVAHMDIVPKPPKKIYFDYKEKVFWAEGGLGADDRAGIFAIMSILKERKYRPSVLFTDEEEIGGFGAQAFCDDSKFENINFFIEIDRRGHNQAVFYDTQTKEFKDYITSFGFTEETGTFSDISIICEPLKICGVNLSAGYKNEHTTSETLNLSYLEETIRKIKAILDDEPHKFKWEGSIKYRFENTKVKDGDKYICRYCKHSFSQENIVPFIISKHTVAISCSSCAKKHISWCIHCGKAFEKRPNELNLICNDCKGVYND